MTRLHVLFARTVASMLVFLPVGARDSSAAQRGNTKVYGFTEKWTGSGQYAKLGNVDIIIFRFGQFAGSTASNRDSYYETFIENGPPIQIYYFLDSGYVPEMQSLSCRDRVSQCVSVSLIPTKLYRTLEHDQGKRVTSLVTKMRAILESLPRDEKNEKVNRLRQICEELGQLGNG
jgi:hypothetical protein